VPPSWRSLLLMALCRDLFGGFCKSDFDFFSTVYSVDSWVDYFCGILDMWDVEYAPSAQGILIYT
jgi:hypothetical protein